LAFFKTFAQSISYQYDAYDNPIYESWSDSKGKNYLKKYTYNYYCQQNNTCYCYPINLYTIADSSRIDSTIQAGLQFVITDELMDVTDPTDTLEIDLKQTHPNFKNGIFTTDYLASSALQAPLPLSTFHASPPATVPADDYHNIFYIYNSYVPNKLSFLYDDHSNVIQSYDQYTRRHSSAIWDTYIGEKIASVSNAKYGDIAYTSFEGNYLTGSSLDYSKGNWLFDPSYIDNFVSSVTGHWHYDLWSGNSGTNITSNFSLANNENYILSFWLNVNGTLPTVQMGSSNITISQQIVLNNGWTLFTANITGNGNPIIISQNTSTTIIGIDELRLYPANATMRTAAYEPLFGIESICDERNNIIHYQYDPMGRLNIVRDIDGNILSLSSHIVDNIDN